MKTFACAALLALAHAPFHAHAAPLVVHEWGTFTSFQDETGAAIGGINTDDEPVPDFVHTVRSRLLLWPTQLPNSWFGKGFPQAHPDVTLRLETPVMYFYPEQGEVQLDVRASFRGGWLTEFYPRAEAFTPGLTRPNDSGQAVLGGIDAHTLGSLTWTGLRVGVDAPGPQTDEEVWLAPRRVRAASVASADGEAERYLFYRGVGKVDALVRVTTAADGSWLDVGVQPTPGVDMPSRWSVPMWLVDIRDDGRAAFVEVESFGPGIRDRLRLEARFAEGSHSRAQLTLLRQRMLDALIRDGLFEDEARAMLDTWQVAYFQTTGLRLFYLVPQAWTDHYLPLEFSEPVDLTRVMVGRVELITPRQRQLLARIAAGPVEPFPREAVNEVFRAEGDSLGSSPRHRSLLEGTMDIEDLGVPLPEVFVAYKDLGRLRNALVLHECEARPTPALEAFIDEYRLAAHEVVPPEPVATAVTEEFAPTRPAQLSLDQNYPNPLNPETTIRFELPEPGHVRLAVYNLAGQRVARLADDRRAAGTHTLRWDGRDDDGRGLASGVYLYRLETELAVRTRKMLVLQ